MRVFTLQTIVKCEVRVTSLYVHLTWHTITNYMQEVTSKVNIIQWNIVLMIITIIIWWKFWDLSNFLD